MKPSDFVYQQAYKQFSELGYPNRECECVASDAVRRWSRAGGGLKAVQAAIEAGKKAHKKEPVKATA